jgi:hypothetical protein
MVEEVTFPGYVTSWGAFKINVRMAFGDLDRVAMACLKIKEVKQGKESMDNYVIWFEEFEGLTAFDDAALAEIFKEGLAPQILSWCYGLEHVPMTLTAWKEKSRLFAHHLAKLHQYQRHRNLGQTQPQQQQRSQHQPTPGTSHQGAQQASSSSTPPQVKKESQEERLAQTRHGKCYKCSGEGHWAWSCPQKGSKHGGKPSQSDRQIRATETDESHFEEHQDDDRKGKGKATEEKEALPDRVEQTGIDRWNDMDKKDLAMYLKGKGF